MFMVLKKIQNNIRRDIKEVEQEWGDNPQNDYYFSEISALRRALNYVLRAESQEYTALDRWANRMQGKN
tara:strand:+ start:873 stop:1079 length:207 start_codon:yes stop_codon:yes gene_type:complete